MAPLSLIVPWLMGCKTPWTLLYLWVKLTHEVTAPWYAQNWSKLEVGEKVQKNTLKSPIDPLWGPKHLRSSYFCELSLHTEFQSNSTSPSIRLFMALQQNNNRTRKSLKTVATYFPLCSAKGTKVIPCRSASGKAPTLVPKMVFCKTNSAGK